MLFLIGIIPYLIKLPIIPFHIWLPKNPHEFRAYLFRRQRSWRAVK
jgi:NADH:ubiquinone oxidoreductase subunit 4 (subunit M)